MSPFQTFEVSPFGAEPKELYAFVLGTRCWLYTSADEDTDYLGKTYLARTISRGSFTRNEENASSNVEIRIDRGLAVAPMLVGATTPQPMQVTIFRLHRPDEGDAIRMFYGRVANSRIEREEVVVTVASPLGRDEKQIPRERILRTCPHALYGKRCRVDPTAWSVSTTIAVKYADANQYGLSSDGGNPDGWLTAGVLVKDSTGQRGFIQEHIGNTIRLLIQMPGLVAGDAVTLYAGCDRTVETCRDKFNNVPQFGGFPLHPERNPFVQLKAD